MDAVNQDVIDTGATDTHTDTHRTCTTIVRTAGAVRWAALFVAARRGRLLLNGSDSTPAWLRRTVVRMIELRETFKDSYNLFLRSEAQDPSLDPRKRDMFPLPLLTADAARILLEDSAGTFVP